MSRPLWLLLVFSATPAFAQPPRALEFAIEAEALYQSLEYEQCLKSVDKGRRAQGSAKDRSEVELFAGLCEHGLGRGEQAARRFQRAAKLNPGIRLPVYVSPKVQEFFRASVPVPKRKSQFAEAPRKKAPPRSTPPVAKETEPAVVAQAPVPNAAPDAGDESVVVVEQSPAHAPPLEPLVTTEPLQSPVNSEAVADSTRPPAGDAPVASRVRLKPSLAPPLDRRNRGPHQEMAPLFNLQRHLVPIGLGSAALLTSGLAVSLGMRANSTAQAANSARFESDAVSLGREAQQSMVLANVAYSVAATAAIGGLVSLFLLPAESPPSNVAVHSGEHRPESPAQSTAQRAVSMF